MRRSCIHPKQDKTPTMSTHKANDKTHDRSCGQQPKLVTIITAVYNGARHLPTLLNSLMAQTSKDWLCILVDDGSTDESPDVLSRFANDDARIKVITQTNQGCGEARNTALKLVTTPYVMFADQDDLLHPQAVEIAVSAICAADTDCLLFGFQHFTGEPDFPVYNERPAPVREQRNGTALVTGRRNSWPILVWRHVFRTAAVRPVPFPPISGGEDQAWMIELSWRNLKWASIPQVLYYNRITKDSGSRGLSDRYIQSVRTSYEWMGERAKLYDVDPRWLGTTIRHMKLMFEISCLYRRLVSCISWRRIFTYILSASDLIPFSRF